MLFLWHGGHREGKSEQYLVQVPTSELFKTNQAKSSGSGQAIG